MICNLCRGHHATHTCIQIQNIDYYDEFDHCNHCFNQYGSNWSNSYTYKWDNQYAYIASLCFYDY